MADLRSVRSISPNLRSAAIKILSPPPGVGLAQASNRWGASVDSAALEFDPNYNRQEAQMSDDEALIYGWRHDQEEPQVEHTLGRLVSFDAAITAMINSFAREKHDLEGRSFNDFTFEDAGEHSGYEIVGYKLVNAMRADEERRWVYYKQTPA